MCSTLLCFTQPFLCVVIELYIHCKLRIIPLATYFANPPSVKILKHVLYPQLSESLWSEGCLDK